MVDSNGWIVPAENPQALAHAIQEAIESRGQLDRMGEKSLEIVRNRYGPSHIAQRHIALYTQLINARQPQ